MKDLHNTGLRGNLTDFIEKFLLNRSFKVRDGSTLSDVYDQEQGVPQECILSTTQFSIKGSIFLRKRHVLSKKGSIN